jgi:hypothetical protein
MPSLITGDARTAYENAREDVFLTFAREFIVFKTPQVTIIDSNTNYNYTYGTQPEGQGTTDYVNYTVQSGIFSGCIQYRDHLDRFFSNPQGSRDENFRIVTDGRWCRLKVYKTDFDNYIKDSQVIQLDGKNFSIFEPERPHGLFSPRYYTLYLELQN